MPFFLLTATPIAYSNFYDAESVKRYFQLRRIVPISIIPKQQKNGSCYSILTRLTLVAPVTYFSSSSFRSLCKAGAVQFLIAVTLNIVHLGLYFRPIAFCLIFWAAQAVVYLLSYAVCFIGIYGLNFSTGGWVGELSSTAKYT